MADDSLPVVPEEETALPAGARLGKYQIARQLGAGGMGAVYEATHLEIGKRVAIKTLSPAVAAIPGARQRFLREAQLTSRLRHPHIVDLTDMGTEGRIAYLVMELLAGEDLSHRLERTGPMVPRELVDLMLPVCSALVAAHEAGIVHRDLKPHNIFLASTAQGITPKVLDFGISKSSDSDSSSSLTSTGSVIGTPHYLAPEQVKDARTASAASDQYSIGVIFYRCLTNANPFEGDTLFAVLQAIVMQKPTPVRERRPEVPEGLARVVERAMNPLPWERFASVRDLGRALLPFASPKARVIWEDTFPDATPAPVVATDLPRATHTMPMPTPVPASLRSGAPFESGTLSPAITSTEHLRPAGARSGRLIGGIVVALAVAVGGFVLFARGSSEPPPLPPAAPARAAAPPPVTPPPPTVPSEPNGGLLGAPPVAPARQAPPVEHAQDTTRKSEPAKPEEAERVGAKKDHAPSPRHRPSPHHTTHAAPAQGTANPYGAAVLD
jgi:serine/threonine-protein kinase